MRDQWSVIQQLFPSSEPTLWYYYKFGSQGNGSFLWGSAQRKTHLTNSSLQDCIEPSLRRVPVARHHLFLDLLVETVHFVGQRQNVAETKRGDTVWKQFVPAHGGTDGEKIRRETCDVPLTITKLLSKQTTKNTTEDTKLPYSHAQSFLNFNSVRKAASLSTFFVHQHRCHCRP